MSTWVNLRPFLFISSALLCLSPLARTEWPRSGQPSCAKPSGYDLSAALTLQAVHCALLAFLSNILSWIRSWVRAVWLVKPPALGTGSGTQ
jgi:hypothetical protein